MARTAPDTTDRDRLGAEIAEAIARLREPRLDTAVRLGVQEGAVPALAAGGKGLYSVDRLLEFCEPLGLVPSMTISGLNTGPATEPRTNIKPRAVEHDYTEVGRLHARLLDALAHQVATAGKTQQQLADETGLNRVTLSQLRNKDAKVFRLDRLLSHARALGLTVDLAVNPA